MAASTTLHSNALNFMSFLNSGVDPRTGLYTVSISLPELKTDDLAGPVIPLGLSFSPLNTQDSGYGLGWDLPLSQYTPHNQILSLSTGETFKVTGSGSGDQLVIKEKKLDSFHFHDLGNEGYKVVHKSGLVEFLKVMGTSTHQIALPYQIQSPDGRSVTLTYKPFADHQVLASISDSQRTLLTLKRTARNVDVVLMPDQGPVRFVLTLDEDDYRVSQITLPTAENACWRFKYETLDGLLCVRQVCTPTGAHETVAYDDAGHVFPGVSRPPLRRVTEHSTDPGQGQPALVVGYSYSGNNTVNSHNFLGNDASGLIWEDNGLDNLYKVSVPYQYGTTESLRVAGQVVRTVERTFNRFHLLTEETTTQNRKMKKTLTLYYADDGKDFDQQPNYFQLPKTVTDSWYNLDNANQVRRETVSSQYDSHGNLTEQTQANGIVETSTWYPAAGESGQCPPDPEGFVRQMKTRTVTPAQVWEGEPAPVLRTRYRYQALEPVQGASQPWLVLSEESLLQVEVKAGSETETLLHSTAHTYIQQPTDRLTHGRPLNDTFTLNGISTFTAFTYEKKQGTARADETVLKITQTLSSSLDSERKVITLEHSLLNGEPLLTRDDTDVEIRYVYDGLGRVLSETVAPGTDYEATRSYTYVLVATDGQTARQEATDVKGVRTCSHLDGLNRVVKEERQDADGDGALRQTYAAEYDSRGQLLNETQYDWLGTRNLALKSIFGYDDWGQQRSETGPDGVVTFSVTNPFGWQTDGGYYLPTQSTWQQSGQDSTERYGLTVTRLNAMMKPDAVERFNLAGQSIGKQRYEYDGLGRTLKEINVLGHGTRYRYDAFDRMVQSTLPNDDIVFRDYALHSSADLISQMNVQPASQQTPRLDVGTQVFDGIGRLTQLTVGKRNEGYRYKSGSLQASERITPSQASILYEYAHGLTEEPINTHAPDETVDFSYDAKSARMKTSSNSLGERTYDYDNAGHLKRDTWTSNGQAWATEYVSSLQGRQLSRTDVSGLRTVYTHDATGRAEQVTQGSLQANFGYDSLGRLQRTLTRDLAAQASLETLIDYDEHSREIQRTLNLSNHPQRTISQVWQADDQLKSRHLKEADVSLLHENFEYDNRGRLWQYTCSGQTLPQDRYGNEIVKQLFRFDALDNITQSQTTFADGSSDLARFTYAGAEPCQLTEVTHSHADYPDSTAFAYDEDGNMLNDEAGQTLSYDSQGRLLGVETASGDSVSRYRYDGHNHLVTVKQGSNPETARFYQGDRLSNTVQEQIRIQYLYDGDTPLGQQQVGDDAETLLLLSNASNTVLGENRQAELRTTVYSPYGERNDNTQQLQCLLAFNGEVRDPASGWYLLGKGYRAYSPTLMRFHSPDALSPFGTGGLNPYGYCQGNPIAFQDPTGHSVGKLEHRQFQANQSAVFLGLLTTVVFAGLAVASLGTATPFMAAVTIVGVGLEATSTGFQTAALLEHDPDKARSLSEVAIALDRGAMVIGFMQMGKGALKKLGTKAAGQRAWGSNVTPWSKDPLGQWAARGGKMTNGSDPLAEWTARGGRMTSGNAAGASAPSARAPSIPAADYDQASKVSRSTQTNAPRPTSSISSTSSSSSSSTSTTSAVSITPTPSPAPVAVKAVTNKARQWPVVGQSGMKYAMPHPTQGATVYDFSINTSGLRN